MKEKNEKSKKKSSKKQINNKIGQSQKYQPGATFYTRNNSTPSSQIRRQKKNNKLSTKITQEDQDQN